MYVVWIVLLLQSGQTVFFQSLTLIQVHHRYKNKVVWETNTTAEGQQGEIKCLWLSSCTPLI